MLYPGEIFAGKYRIEKQIGEGGMSKVYRAEDTNERLNKLWAVKEISKANEVFVVDETKAMREIEIMKSLDHPALPRVVDVIENEQYIYLVMDYISGPTLQVILEENGVQNEKAVVAWMLDVCDILTYLHNLDPPVIYRDLKPSNLMINSDGHIKIIDFGIAKEYRGAEATMPLGSPGWASPEHFTGNPDERSDIYTVGSTAYTLLTGKNQKTPPYYIQPIRKINPALSQGLEKIILKATRANPDERYQTAAELANALESYEKLDDDHIEGLDKEIGTYKKKLMAAIGVTVIGLVITATGFIFEQNSYNSLVSGIGGNKENTIENLKKAIDLKPAREEAYLALIEAYASDGRFTESESEDFFKEYNAHINNISGDTSYDIGEAYLRYYTGESDSSARAKLLTAEPFFKAAEKDGSHRETASNYLFLAEYYKTYVMADDSLLTGAGTKEDYQNMLKVCEDTLEGAPNEKMKAIVAEATVNLISSQCSEMKKTGVSQSELEKTMKEAMKYIAEDEKQTSDDVMLSIKRAYHPKEEGAAPKEVIEP